MDQIKRKKNETQINQFLLIQMFKKIAQLEIEPLMYNINERLESCKKKIEEIKIKLKN